MQAVRMDKSIDNSEWLTDEDKLIDKATLPALPGYHILIQPVSVKKETKGGIILPDRVKDDVAYLTTVGKVLKLGDLAYQDEVKFPQGAWCKEDDDQVDALTMAVHYVKESWRLEHPEDPNWEDDVNPRRTKKVAYWHF